MKYLLFYILIFSQFIVAQDITSGSVLEALRKAKSAPEFQKIVSASFKAGKIDQAITGFTEYLFFLEPKNIKHVVRAEVVYDYLKLLQLVKGSKVSVEFINWISHKDRLSKYIYSLDPKDDIGNSLKLMDTLFD